MLKWFLGLLSSITMRRKLVIKMKRAELAGSLRDCILEYYKDIKEENIFVEGSTVTIRQIPTKSLKGAIKNYCISLDAEKVDS